MLQVNQWKIPTKDFVLGVISGFKNGANIQNDMLYVCNFTYFAR